jgi:hypothetical protein
MCRRGSPSPFHTIKQVPKAEKTNESYFLASWNAAIDFLEYTPIQHFKENHSGTRIKGLYNKQVI